MAPAGDDPRQHPWWQHLPASRRTTTLSRRRWHRLRTAVASRWGRLGLLLALYAALLVWLARSGAGALSLLLLLPLLLLPALAALAWWLTWQEFHR